MQVVEGERLKTAFKNGIQQPGLLLLGNRGNGHDFHKIIVVLEHSLQQAHIVIQAVQAVFIPAGLEESLAVTVTDQA